MEKTNGEKEKDKQPIEKMRKRIVKGGLEREDWRGRRQKTENTVFANHKLKA